jgi:hypothetical protein
MKQTHEWPGEWSKTAPQVADHPPGAELVWAVRGEPFTRPILARSNVGARIQRFASKYRFAAECIARNPEVMRDLQKLANEPQAA